MSEPDSPNGPKEGPNQTHTGTGASDREGLLAKARAFLRLPDIASEDVDARRAFLAEKGLSVDEIDHLISETPPPIPPRTYPRPAPSKLPIILYATFKLLVLLSGASIFSAAMYFTYIYPRLAATFGARGKLVEYQTGLIARLQVTSKQTRQLQRENTLVSAKALPDAKFEEVKEDSTVTNVSTLPINDDGATPPNETDTRVDAEVEKSTINSAK
ncbi:hypothetical protein FRC17_008936, partial [Serendipita sp. 399]